MDLIRILIIWLFVMMAAAPSHAQEPLTILSSDWPPFASENAERPGFFLEIVREAFRISGFEVKFEFAPWARCLNAVQHGACFASFPFAQTPDREAFGLYSRPVFMTRNPVLYNPKRLPGYDFEGMESLRNYRLGGLLGWFYLKEWEKRGYGYHSLTDQYTGFRMLNAGRIDLFVFDEFAGKYYLDLKPKFAKTVAFSKASYANAKLYLMASRKFPESEKMMGIFNDGLIKLKENGFVDKVARKYNIPAELFIP